MKILHNTENIHNTLIFMTSCFQIHMYHLVIPFEEMTHWSLITIAQVLNCHFTSPSEDIDNKTEESRNRLKRNFLNDANILSKRKHY